MDEQLECNLRELLRSAASKVDRNSFAQEPHFTSAFFGKLHNEEVHNSAGQYIRLKFSASDDRGPGTAESTTGIDVSMVFEWIDASGKSFEKAVVLQAKNRLMHLPSGEARSLRKQCKKMRAITHSYVVMDCPYDGSIPTLCNPAKKPPYWTPPPIALDDYLIDHIFTCTRGDTSDTVLGIAKRSDRRLVVTTNVPRPTTRRL